MINDPFNPASYGPLDIANFDFTTLLDFLRKMVFVRRVENKLAVERQNGAIGGPVHLSIGQEAIPVAVSSLLSSKDAIFCAHRSHGHLLSLGEPNIDRAYRLFCEVLGRSDGFSSGLGGSMHLSEPDTGFMGSVPIVAGTVPLAVGAAFKNKFHSDEMLSVAYLGDGAIEEGIVFESLNFAKVNKLPTVFIVENNQYASHMHISQRKETLLTYPISEALGIKNYVLDGNNVCEIASSLKDPFEKIRQNPEPIFVEAVTYRFLGHVDWRDDIDVGITRSKDEVESWRVLDPIKRLTNKLLELNENSESVVNEINNEMHSLISLAWQRAQSNPHISSDKLTDLVYKCEV